MHESYFQNINNVEKRTSSLSEPWNWRLWSNSILYHKGEAWATGLKCAKATPTHHLAGMLKAALKGNSHRGEQENTAASRHERREGTATTLRGHFYPLPLEERAALFWAHTCACANKRKKKYLYCMSLHFISQLMFVQILLFGAWLIGGKSCYNMSSSIIDSIRCQAMKTVIRQEKDVGTNKLYTGWCESGAYVSVWLPLIKSALLISGISGEGQMPRQNRLEVTPPPAHAHSGPDKGSDRRSGCQSKTR